jgi:hypothetical protein
MFNRKGRMIAAVGAALVTGGLVQAADQASDSRIKALEAKVAELETRQATNSKDMATTIEAVLRDAERRSQLMAAGDASAGWENGFFIKSGDWELRPGAIFQFRQVTNFRQDVGGTDDTTENGFEVRRMKLSLEGTAVTKNLTYSIVWNTNRDTDSSTGGFAGSVFLEDAWARYMFSDNCGMRVGQGKNLFSHEWLISDARIVSVERSMLDSLLGGGVVGRTQGVTAIYGGYNANNPINLEVGLTDGANQFNTNFVDKAWDWGVAGRVEWKAMGDWRNYRDFTAKGNTTDLLVLGAGGDWSQSGDFNQFVGNVDAQWENAQGLGAYGAVLARNLDASSGDDTTDWGALIQANYLLAPAWEVFARYDFTKYDSAQIANEDLFQEISVGVVYYLGQDGSALHRAKVTVDLSYLPSGAPKAITGAGILDSNDANEEWMLRAQFQLWI